MAPRFPFLLSCRVLTMTGRRGRSRRCWPSATTANISQPTTIILSFFTSTAADTGNQSSDNNKNNSTTTSTITTTPTKDPLFLHVGPSGDCWTGSSIFAAKHLQPDYVQSIPLFPPHNADDLCIDTLLEILEDDINMAQELYDNPQQPLAPKLLERVKQEMSEKERDT